MDIATASIDELLEALITGDADGKLIRAELRARGYSATSRPITAADRADLVHELWN
jgi:hypothetical protein